METLKDRKMVNLKLDLPKQRLKLLCIGAHSDDLEIGCGGTILKWLNAYARVDVTWVVVSAPGQRHTEARSSADEFLQGVASLKLVIRDFRDGYLPAYFSEVKELFEELKVENGPDIILTHRLEDRHQDHRLLGELTWQTFRNHLILEYEIPKYEGDLGQPNFFVPLSSDVCDRKVMHLMRHFGSQRSKGWFTEDTFTSLMRLRGLESKSSEKFAEAFYCRKLTV